MTGDPSGRNAIVSFLAGKGKEEAAELEEVVVDCEEEVEEAMGVKIGARAEEEVLEEMVG